MAKISPCILAGITLNLSKSLFGALGISTQGFFILRDLYIRIISKDRRKADSGKLATPGAPCVRVPALQGSSVFVGLIYQGLCYNDKNKLRYKL